LNVKVTATESVYPIVAAGAAINDMVLGRRNRSRAGRIGDAMLQVISLLLENKPGALMRVTGLLTSAV